MPDAIDRVLANLEHNARRFTDESARMGQANLNGAATVSNDVVTVTVDGAGILLSAVFTGGVTDPGRWRIGFGDAYSEALAQRRPANAASEVPGLITTPQPSGPIAPEQDEARARMERMLQHSRTLTTPVADLTRTATVDDVSISVNGMRIIVDATVTRSALEAGIPLDDDVMAAYRQALAEIEDAITGQLEGTL